MVLEKRYTLLEIKELGLIKSEENIDILLSIFYDDYNIELKREIVSSIGRQKNDYKILKFIEDNVYNCCFMDLVYQMYRTCLYKQKDNIDFQKLGEDIENYFDNEVIKKMKLYYEYRHNKERLEKHDFSKIVNDIFSEVLKEPVRVVYSVEQGTEEEKAEEADLEARLSGIMGDGLEIVEE